jgi:ABC-type sugar transport system permease subunit
MQRHTMRRYGYLVLLIIIILAVDVYPFFDAVRLSFFEKNLMNPGGDRFTGLSNFVRLFAKEPLFRPVLWNTIVFTLGSVVFEYLLGLGAALLLTSRYTPLKNLCKALVLLPWAVPIAINSLIWKFMLAPNYGFINQILDRIGAHDFLRMNWLGSLSLVMPVVIGVNVWRSFPFYAITLMAGLATIPRELYESAQVDGASWSDRFWHITMPGIKNVSTVVVVLHLIWTFTNFDVIYLLTGGGPLHATEVLPTLLYQEAFDHFDMGYASAIGVFILIFLAVTVGPLFFRANEKG